MRDPFKINGPTVISMSGGRTSAYMLWRVLQSNAGLPDEARVLFANTGKEDEETLIFVRSIEEQWGTKVNWIEYLPDGAKYRVVDFDTASRNGEPFEALIRKRNYLPNPISRFCTAELKIRSMHYFIREGLGWSEWDQMIGIRVDEPRRVSKIRARGASTETVDETMCMPLADAGVTVKDVAAFWKSQPFQLNLPTYNGRTYAGNCDLCFLKPKKQKIALIAEKPARAVWWMAMENIKLSSSPTGGFFRKDAPNYERMIELAKNPTNPFGLEDEAIADCFCGD